MPQRAPSLPQKQPSRCPSGSAYVSRSQTCGCAFAPAECEVHADRGVHPAISSSGGYAPKEVTPSTRKRLAECGEDVEVEDAPPRPSALIESLRAFGYALPTAVADLIDNSITAGARNVWIDFEWHGRDSVISIRDDGRGMSEEVLLEAMRLGSMGPQESRDPDDLGRFGLGLKTASFSQCRLLVVLSKQKGRSSLRCWDLDLVRDTDKWLVRKTTPDDMASTFSALNSSSAGTLVVWGRLDRLVGDASLEDATARDHFYQAADEVVEHVRSTFTDFLHAGDLVIHVNGTPVAPWDPFLDRHAATQALPTETLMMGAERVRVSPFVLPHHSKLSPEDYKSAAGPRGDWAGLQGFYVFRNRRLIVAGGWLGLGMGREKHHDLARVRIDISNSLDDAWQLDVRKSRAHPPPQLRPHLKRIARLVRQKAAEVYRHRGARLVPHDRSSKTFLWVPSRFRGKNVYRLERNHPLVQAVVEASADPRAVAALYRLLEETVPTPLISIMESEEPTSQAAPLEGVSDQEVLDLMRAVYAAMIATGQRPDEAKRRLSLIEPFDRFPELLETFDPAV